MKLLVKEREDLRVSEECEQEVTQEPGSLDISRTMSLGCVEWECSHDPSRLVSEAESCRVPVSQCHFHTVGVPGTTHRRHVTNT